ncbi:MAG: methionine gamma-lyase [Pseudomonadota bacterium]
MSAHIHKAGFSTRAIHYGYNPQDHQGALSPPIFQTSTFAFPTAEYGAACFAGEESGHFYTRISNPTLALLEARLAALENAEAAVVFGSGMGAISATCWTLLEPGDELIADLTLYGCTHALFEHGLKKFGIKITSIDLTNPSALEAAIGPRTRMVYFETPANPNMRLIDIAAVGEIAHRHGVTVVVDSTYCSPYLQQPLLLGADIVVHSATKYINGHGDVTAGVVATSAELAAGIRLKGLKDFTGAVLSPGDAHLILRGLKTLAVRMDRHCDNAEAVAVRLAEHPAVRQVYYPGLEGDPYHALSRRQMRRFGAMIAFELHGGIEAGRRFINALNIFTRAVSLGDTESLVQHPASMTHSTYTAEERKRAMIADGLVRLSIGLEDRDDLLNDIEDALSAMGR